MIDYCVSALLRNRDEVVFRSYISDALKMATESLAHISGGSHPTVRYAELIERQPRVDAENERTPEDVIAIIKGKIRGLK